MNLETHYEFGNSLMCTEGRKKKVSEIESNVKIFCNLGKLLFLHTLQ